MRDEFELELQCLRDENRHLKALLNQHQIAWKETAQAKPLPTPAAACKQLPNTVEHVSNPVSEHGFIQD